MTNIFCGSITLNRLEELQKTVERMLPFVTKYIIVDGGSTDGTIEWLQSLNDSRIELVNFPWQDWFSLSRNQYIERAKQLGCDWLAVCDTDELYDLDTCQNLIRLAEEGEANGINQYLLHAHDVVYLLNGGTDDRVGDFHKPLFFKMYPDTRYEGNPHETLKNNTKRYKGVPVDYQYVHYKIQEAWMDRGNRNYFIGGGGDNEVGNDWIEFRALCSKHGFNKWEDLRNSMLRGDVPQEICEWFIKNKDIHDRGPDSERRSWFNWYYIYLWPSKNTWQYSSHDFPYNYVELETAKRK